MDYLAEISFTSVELRWEQPLLGRAEHRVPQLRGALAEAFRDDARFHQHDETGKPLYRYPLIQYRWQNGYGFVVGWGSGAETLLNLPWLDLELLLDRKVVTVADALINTRRARFDVSKTLLRYQLLSPILLFSQKNFAIYKTLNPVEQQVECERLLVASLLSSFKGLGICFPVNLYAVFSQMRYYNCPYKGQDLLGITGEFLCNALLPNKFAFGRAVSHGYGWVERV